MTDQQQPKADDFLTFDAMGAALDSFAMVTREFVNNGAAANVQVQLLAAELQSYSNRFYVRARKERGEWVAFILGADEGCVNEYVTLATCWIESGSFYWES